MTHPQVHSEVMNPGKGSLVMNARQLKEIGVPDDCAVETQKVMSHLVKISRQTARHAQELIVKVLEDPQAFIADQVTGELAAALLANRNGHPTARKPVTYRTWGANGIDAMSFRQMDNACR
ncbi:MAG: hypothetical protein VB858_14475, partial [Planctomycetaceae bacterium]